MGGLAEYRSKRDFEATSEPAGQLGRSAGRVFVVQKHAARRLHYDFRLELDGTLKSWAVPKGPSLDPRDKRLAIEVEDHPLEYAEFEGVIPRGQYGGGSVIVWDRGRWQPVGDPREGLRRGKLEFDLYGEKLGGRWLLVRTSGEGENRSGSGKPQWLLRKRDDQRARPGAGEALLRSRSESVRSGRTLEEVAADPQRVWQSEGAGVGPLAAELPGAREGSLPDFVEPQLATAAKQPPRGSDWIYEIKLDGYRIQCRIEGGRARLFSRRGGDWTERFAVIAAEAPFLRVDSALLDGEVVWLDQTGRSDFQALQDSQRGAGTPGALFYVAFDLLHLDGTDLRGVALAERKRLLSRLLDPAPAEISRLRAGGHLDGDGHEVLEHICRLGLEGVVAKRASGPYRSGRSADWIKVRCGLANDFVVVGYTASQTAAPLRSLLVAQHTEDGLVYAGKVGSGLSGPTKADLVERLRPLGRASSPLASGLETVGEPAVRWVEPRLVVEVAFTERTRDGVLRHPVYRGLREDKEPSGARRDPGARSPAGRSGAGAGAGGRNRPPRRRPRRPTRLTHPERVLDPASGTTKADLARYYEQVADPLLEELADRPLTLLRCPEGIGGECFYQKHPGDSLAPGLGVVDIAGDDGELSPYLVVESRVGLASLAQLSVLEVHPWGSRVDHPQRPDRLIFDLDPDRAVDWPRVVEAARELRRLLEGLELASWPRLTGGKGVHVVVPIAPALEWKQARALSRAIAGLLVEREPALYTLNPRKAKRQGRIFVDYLRNGFGATAIASYSPRARPGLPVAVPIRWEELTASRRPDHYRLATVPQRLAAQRSDPWPAGAGQRLGRDLRARFGLVD